MEEEFQERDYWISQTIKVPIKIVDQQWKYRAHPYRQTTVQGIRCPHCANTHLVQADNGSFRKYPGRTVMQLLWQHGVRQGQAEAQHYTAGACRIAVCYMQVYRCNLRRIAVRSSRYTAESSRNRSRK